jgi:hypothetical protein
LGHEIGPLSIAMAKSAIIGTTVTTNIQCLAMSKSPAPWLLAIALPLATAASLKAQALPPFFSGDTVGFEAQISTVDSGPALSVHANVSADRKYVTLGSQATDNTLLSLAAFRLAGPSVGGFVGMSTPAVSSAAPPKGQALIMTSILDQRGMILIATIGP